jgi:hypothetical protein
MRNGWSLGRDWLANLVADARAPLLLAHTAADARSDGRGDVRGRAGGERGIQRGHATAWSCRRLDDPSPRSLEQPDLACAGDRLRAGADAEFAIDGVGLGLDGVGGDMQAQADLAE